jgi:IS5 family transposase
MLAGFFLSLVQDRKLMREAQVNLAIRWFAGYRLDERLPDHSSLTRIRQRWGETVFERIFQRTVKQCLQAGLVNGETVHVDSTLLRAHVSYASYSRQHGRKVWEQNHGTGPKTSSSDPEAFFATDSRKEPPRPSYKQHTAVDDRKGIVIDVAVTTCQINEGNHLPEQLQRIKATTGLNPQRITADSGYAHGHVLQRLEQMGLEPIIPPKPLAQHHKSIPIYRFKYDAQNLLVRCPCGKKLRRSYQDDTGWFYKSRTEDCRGCPLRSRCLSPTVGRRSVHIGHGYDALLRARRRKGCWSSTWRKLYVRHRWQVEGIHGEAKTQHGLHRAVRRGRWNVAIQALLTAAVINLKRLASLLIFYLLLRGSRHLITRRSFYFGLGLSIPNQNPHLPCAPAA